MKILFVVWNYYPNTAATNRTKATVRGMRECGCEVDVISIKPLVSEDASCIRGQIVYNGSFWGTLIGMIRNQLLLIRSIKKYDVVYCATDYYQTIKTCLKLARKYKKRIVHERTEFPDVMYKRNRRLERHLRSYLKIVGKMDKLFVISNPLKDYFVAEGVPEQNIVIYPMIVDSHRFDSIIKQSTESKYMAYCGDMSNNKDGVNDLIEAYGRSSAKMTHKLYLIGKKPVEEGALIINELLKKYDISSSLVLVGEVEREEMPQLLMNADLLLLCRPDNRQALGGFPTKLGEYLSTGNPVLVTRVGDIDKYISDGVNGYIAKPSDPDDFAAKIDYIISHYKDAIIVGGKGKDLANSVFDYYLQTKKILNSISN